VISGVAIMVADLIKKVAEAQVRDLGQVLSLVNASVEDLSDRLATAEREGRFADAADLADGIQKVYVSAASPLPPTQRVILETIGQYWELKATNARSRATAQAAELDIAPTQGVAEPATTRPGLSFGVGVTVSAQSMAQKGYAQSNQHQVVQKSVIARERSPQSGEGRS